MSRVCAHPYSYCRTLARCTSWVWRHPCFAKDQNLSLVCCTSWVWRHPCFAKEQNLSLVCCMSWVWRHPCFLKGQDRILSLHASTLSSHFATVIHWHCTLFLLSGVQFWQLQVIRWGYLISLVFCFVFVIRDIKYQFWKNKMYIYDIRIKWK